MATIDNLQIDINLDDNASDKLKRLADALSALKNITVSASKLNGIAKGINNLNASINAISEDAISKVERLASALSSFSNVNFSNFARMARNMGNMNAGTSSYATLRNQIVPVTVTETPLEEPNWREVGSEVVETADKTGNKIQWVTMTAKELATAMRVVRTAFSGIKAVMGAMFTPFRRLGEAMRGFIRSIGRIALYRLLRGIIKSITQGIKEGIQNLAKFSKAMNELDTHQANKVMSLYASNFLYLKNTIATAIIPILKTLEPIISSVINRVIDFTNVVAQLFSLLSGSSTYTKAKYFYVDYAESLDKASGSAGKLNKQLAQFDELNNLTTNQNSGKDATEDYLSMFEDPVPIADWIQNLKDKIEGGDWKGIGKSISTKIVEGLGSIDWTANLQKASQAGKGLAEFFNGLIDPKAFYEIGEAIGGLIMMGVNFIFEFFETLDWENLGKSIGSGINGFANIFDGKKVAKTVSSIADGLFRMLKNAVKTIDWLEVFKDMFDFLSTVTIENMDLIILAVSIIWGLNALKTFALPAIGTALKTLLTTFGASIAKIILVAVGGYFLGNFIGIVWGAIEQAITGNSDTLELYLSANPFYDTKMGDRIYDLLFGHVAEDYGKLRQLLEEAELQAVQSAKVIGEQGDEIKGKIKGIYDTITANHPDLIKKLGETASKIKNGKASVSDIEEMIAGIGDAIQKVDRDQIKEFFSQAKWKGYRENIASILSYANMFNIGTDMGNGVVTAFAKAMEKIRSALDEFIKNPFSPNAFRNLVESLVTIINDSLNGVKQTPSLAGMPESARQAYVNAGGTLPTTTTVVVQQVVQTNANGDVTVGGTSSGKTLVKNPHYSNAQAQEAWERAHPKSKYEWYAKGGFPDQGSMFFAGESGAELVGNINGRTGVANTDQIVEAMYTATYDAMSTALAENPSRFIIEGDADGMFRIMQQKANNFFTRTGRPAF